MPRKYDANNLVSGTNYEIKTWNKMSTPFLSRKRVTFNNYIFSGSVVGQASFKMRDLAPGLGQTCVVTDASGATITLTVGADIKVWVDAHGNRITFGP